jgi:hypothetical protein
MTANKQSCKKGGQGCDRCSGKPCYRGLAYSEPPNPKPLYVSENLIIFVAWYPLQATINRLNYAQRK